MKNQTKNGYIALISVIIIGAILLMVVLSTSYIGVTEGMNSLLASNSAEARSLASACAEDALMNLKNDQNYSGNQTITLDNGQCQILAIIVNGGARTIETTGIVNHITKKLKITASQIAPSIIISSWQEVADF
jgi:hypothetical protein